MLIFIVLCSEKFIAFVIGHINICHFCASWPNLSYAFFKALLAENKNAASEIKTLKSHLSSSRAIVVEKAVAKDEINKIKSELTSKTIEVEKANIKLKKLGQQLSTSATEFKSLTELKISQEKEIKELREKVKISSNQDAADNLEKKAKDVEISNLSEKLRNCEDGKSELQERLDFYIQQCSVFEKNDSRHQDRDGIRISMQYIILNHSLLGIFLFFI